MVKESSFRAWKRSLALSTKGKSPQYIGFVNERQHREVGKLLKRFLNLSTVERKKNIRRTLYYAKKYNDKSLLNFAEFKKEWANDWPKPGSFGSRLL